MKLTSLVIVFFVVMMLVSCSKSVSTSLEGKWNVLSDSTIITGPSVTYEVYRGAPGDYFIFSTDGKLFINENGSTTTSTYQLIPVDTLLLPGIGYSVNGITEPSVFTIKDDVLRIVANPPGNLIPPGHQYQRIINLKK